ncbi:MAG TPA: outer membrane protein transport protein [Steroidobacteraceae bacterium]|nr:outer membrane protein transport protein [Steroidobacteraceae bacterium]
MKRDMKRRISLGVVTSTAAIAATQAFASGFALQEQNVSGLGNSYAGSGAVAEDASTIFFNGAGLTQLDKASVTVSLNDININSKFRNGGSNGTSVNALAQPLGSEGGNAGGNSIVPALYASMPFANKFAIGLGINAPFGLKTEYSDDFMGRFQATKSEVKTMNVDAVFAFKPNNLVSFSVGVDYQKLDAELNNMLNFDAVAAQVLAGPPYSVPPTNLNALLAANPGLQGSSSVKGSDSKWGYDLGVLITPSDATKVGLSYRSAINYHVTGTATFTAPTSTNGTIQAVITGARATALADGPITLDIKLPASARVAVAHVLENESNLELLFEVSWTEWSSVQALTIVRTSGTVLKNTPENWSDTWRAALGGNYKLSNNVKLRAGVAVDSSPVGNGYRTPRLPDNDRMWVSLGAQWNIGSSFVLDAGYAHLFANDADMYQSDGYGAAQGYPNGLLIGTQKSSIDILGVQGTFKF